MLHQKDSKTNPALAISVDALTFSYTPDSQPVLNIPQWKVSDNQHVFLSGPSGSGKSTLLNLLSGTLTPTSGSISLLGESFSSLSPRQRDKFRAQHIGVVFQQFNLISYLSVEQNIHAAVYFAQKQTTNAVTSQRLLSLLEALRLPQSILKQKADALSIGQQQRVAIARALINSPELLIVDEPTSALDTAARDSFMALLKNVAKDSTMVFVSHDMGMASHFDTTYRIDDLSELSTTQEQASGASSC